MNTWFRKVGVGAVALTLAGVLAGCNNGNGGGGSSNLIQLFFGINGNGNCSQVTVEVDLDAAEAIIARDEEDDLRCDLNTDLDAAGCYFQGRSDQHPNGLPEILPNGNLRAIISGCTIPAVKNLFNCMFENVDISELQETASAICACKVEGCDGNPPVCISEDPDPTSCEDCTNGQDDDGNGLEDCEDPNCRNSPACQETTTTSTTSTSVTVSSTTTTDTVTTTSSTTTSTTNPLDLSCRVVFTLEDDVALGALRFNVDYSDVPGGFAGKGEFVECANLVPPTANAFASFNDEDLDKTLRSGFISVPGFSGPNLDLAECTLKASATPLKSDFAITVIEAADPSTDQIPVDPLPTVKVGTIDCDGGEPTTTTMSDITTTTIDNVTTTTIGGNDQLYDITFRLQTLTAPKVGALQYIVNYAAATGSFEGGDDLVDGATCEQLVIALLAGKDDDATSTLEFAIASSSGFTAPRDLVTCVFSGDAGDPPIPNDFTLTVTEAAEPSGAPLTATLTTTVAVRVP